MSDPFEMDGVPMPASWPADNAKIYERDAGRCVIPVYAGPGMILDGRWQPCRHPAQSTHHRNHHHTDNRPSNRLSVCGDGTTGHHGQIEAHPAESMRFRWSVSRHQADPAALAVWLWHPYYGLGWYALSDDYGVNPVLAPDGEEGPADG